MAIFFYAHKQPASFTIKSGDSQKQSVIFALHKTLRSFLLCHFSELGGETLFRSVAKASFNRKLSLVRESRLVLRFNARDRALRSLYAS